MTPTAIKPIKVLIVDDHEVVRKGLQTFLGLHDDIEIIGEAGDGQTAVDLTAQLAPDVILMDLVMPCMDGIAATRVIHELQPGVQIIALTSFTDEDKIIPAIQAGAASYLLKDVSADVLVEAIRAVQRGERRLHPEVMRKLMEQVAKPPTASPAAGSLTPRELEVLALVAQGKHNRDIAAALIISEKTAKMHISNILAKLGLEDRTQMAIYAIQNGLVDSGKM
jgi:NarL family two-component system response regulator LiaR